MDRPQIHFGARECFTDPSFLFHRFKMIAVSYSNNGTFTVTTTYGASASLTFNGTAVWIYGAKRANHGPYNITLDGQTYRDDGFYGGQAFQQVLFSAVGLNGTKPHTVSIVNSHTDAARPYLDIDLVRPSS
jgi:hypothetical protein